MCMIEKMREQARKDMARYRREYGPPEHSRNDLPKGNAKPTKRQKAWARNMRRVLDAVRPFAEPTSEIAARLNKPARSVGATLNVLHREGRIAKYARPNSRGEVSWSLNGSAK